MEKNVKNKKTSVQDNDRRVLCARHLADYRSAYGFGNIQRVDYSEKVQEQCDHCLHNGWEYYVKE